MPIRWTGKQLEKEDSAGVTDDSNGDLTTGLRQGYELGSLTDGLVAYFPFDGGVEDKALSNDGTDNTSADYVSGKVGNKAKDFDGDDNVDSQISKLLGNEGVTVSAWVNFDSASNQVTILGGYSSENSTTTAVLYNNNSNDLAFYLKDDSGTADRASSGINPSIDTWYFVTGVYDGSELRIYVNGVEEGSVSQSYSDTSLDSFRIGEHPYNGDNLEGSVDDVRVYDRALSQPEIEALYDRTSTQKIMNKDRLTSGLVGHWPLNEDSASNAYDLSGNGNDSTGVTGTTTAVGLGGTKSRGFSGNGSIDLPSIALDNTSGGLSFGAFVRPRFDTTSARGVTIWRWKSSGSNNTGFDWGEHHGGNGDLNFEWSDDGLQYKVPENWQGQWKHLFFVADDQDPVNMKIFVDGQEVASGGVGGNQTVSASSTSYIGVGDGYAFDMNDFRIYNRALTKSEIEELSRQGGL